MHLIKIYIFHKIQINKLIYMNLKHNFVLVKLNKNKIEETFILKLKILYFILFFNLKFSILIRS